MTERLEAIDAGIDQLLLQTGRRIDECGSA